MKTSVWVQQGTGDEPGWQVWALEFPGFATWAPDRRALLHQLPAKFGWHVQWLRKHGFPTRCPAPEFEITEQVTGNEVLFSPDRDPATPDEIRTTQQLLQFSRTDLLHTLEALPSGAFEWDPPYRAFASWASWRTIRAILAHIANTETHYYLPNIGLTPSVPVAQPEDNWQEFLLAHRRAVLASLEQLTCSEDLVRVTDTGAEQWSVRKVLRRLIRHELLHWKSIMRIGQAYKEMSGY